MGEQAEAGSIHRREDLSTVNRVLGRVRVLCAWTTGAGQTLVTDSQHPALCSWTHSRQPRGREGMSEQVSPGSGPRLPANCAPPQFKAPWETVSKRQSEPSPGRKWV